MDLRLNNDSMLVFIGCSVTSALSIFMILTMELLLLEEKILFIITLILSPLLLPYSFEFGQRMGKKYKKKMEDKQ